MERLRFGMIGGAAGSFIADIHRKSAEFDGLGELAAGCFSRDYGKSLAFGRENGLDEDRIYRTFEDMARAEAARPDPVDFVIVAAPNHVHYECCKAFLSRGIHVVCDKPMTTTAQEARDLQKLAEDKDLLFAVTYPYSAMPAAKYMKELVSSGGLGDLIMVKGEYLSDNLLAPNEKLDSGMLWRIDPEKSGPSTCCADIGVHAQHLLSYVTGLDIRELSADMSIYGEGRTLDTDFTATIRYENGVKGHLWCSNVAAGRFNDLNVALYGTKGSAIWSLEEPDIVYLSGGPGETIAHRVGRTSADGDPEKYRLPAGQGEGYYLAFANIYRAFMTALKNKKESHPVQDGSEDQPAQDAPLEFPGARDGVAGMEFVEACIASSAAGGAFVEVK